MPGFLNDAPARPALMEKSILVTGGSGFIGSNFILQWIEQEASQVVNLDKLTYAGNPRNLISISSDPRYCFAQGDICDRERVRELLQRHQPVYRRSVGLHTVHFTVALPLNHSPCYCDRLGDSDASSHRDDGTAE